ncbi:MAG: 4Fe-4S dicluster domain-containing protein [Candidatus Bathyarchaeota archaeon]
MVACKTEHQISTGEHNGHEYCRIRVLEYETGKFPHVKRVFAPIICVQCENAPCVDICKTGALHHREDGIVIVDKNKCSGCKQCIQACQFNALYFNEEKHIVDKCDLCVERLDKELEPACVETCMNRAITFGDLEDPNSEVSKITKRSKVRPDHPLRPAYFNFNQIFKPSIYYTESV